MDPATPRLLLLTHGDVGEAMRVTAEKILGPVEGVTVLTNAELSGRALSARIESLLDSRETHTWMIVVVDMACGSCWTAAQMAARGKSRVALLSGVNLPMILTYVNKREVVPVQQLVESMQSSAQRSIAGIINR
jgi:mannose/fructose-specific phosphotransferase system component IIA